MAGIGIIGLGAVGSQLVQRLNASKLNTLVYLYDTNISKTVSLIDEVDENFISSQSPRIENEKISTLIITSPPGQHLETAQRAIKKGISIISTSDRISDIMGLLKLKSLAEKTCEKHRLNFNDLKTYSSPRRLAIEILGLPDKENDRMLELKGPPFSVAKDENNYWTKAAEGFARKNNFPLKIS